MSRPAPAPADVAHSPAPSTRSLRLVQVLTVVVVILAIAGTLWLHAHQAILERVARSPFALPALFVASILSSATLFLPVPGLALTTLMGGLLSPWAVGIVAGIGQTLGEITGYMAGYSGQGLVNRTPAYTRIEGWMKSNQRAGALVVFVLALIPNPFFDAAGMAAGVLRFPVSKYLLATSGGKIIKNIFFAYGGSLTIDWLMRLLGS